MENLKRKRKLLSICIVLTCGLLVFRMHKAIESIPILLFMLIFAAGVATGGFISVSKRIWEEKNKEN